MTDSSVKNWTESFRIITPVFLLLISLLLGGVNSNLCNLREMLKEMDRKLFIHLTNEELHPPKTAIVLRAEFEVYQRMRDRQVLDVKEDLMAIRNLLEKQYDEMHKR